MSESFVIRDATLLTMDPSVGDIVGDLFVRDGIIEAVGRVGEASVDEELDGRDMIVLPGFVDTHRHTWQACVRFACLGWSLVEYMQNLQQHIAPHFTPDDVYAGNLLGALTALDAGITTLRDESHVQNTPEHGDAAIAALREAGIRASFGHGWPSSAEYMRNSSLPHPADLERIRREVLNDDDALVTMHAHLRGPSLSTMETTTAELRRARDLGLRSSLHIGAEIGGDTRELLLLDEDGLLGPDLTFVHCCVTSEEDLKRMHDSGGSASAAPLIEAVMPGLGYPATARLLRAGVRPTFGVDVEVAAGGDMFNVMRSALQSHQLRRVSAPQLEGEDRAFGPHELLEFATIDGARACGLADRTGSITPGKQADLIVLRADQLNLLAGHDPAAAVVAAGHPGNVDSVYVAGQARKRGGELVDVDLDALRRLTEKSSARLFALVDDRGPAGAERTPA
jgi:5-methylthioadenosine/S-adenosylhomocysteine deaminase